MNEIAKKVMKLSDEELGKIAGGVSANYIVALDVLDGKYGNGEERVKKLKAAGYDYETIQRLVNGLSKGYGRVAIDVIDGKYGNGEARVKALKAAGYDAALVQDMVNEILK